jgi:hypothetical protein
MAGSPEPLTAVKVRKAAMLKPKVRHLGMAKPSGGIRKKTRGKSFHPHPALPH